MTQNLLMTKYNNYTKYTLSRWYRFHITIIQACSCQYETKMRNVMVMACLYWYPPDLFLQGKSKWHIYIWLKIKSTKRSSHTYILQGSLSERKGLVLSLDSHQQLSWSSAHFKNVLCYRILVPKSVIALYFNVWEKRAKFELK